MAMGALFIGWGQAVHGREQKALEVFQEALRYSGRLQQDGEIQSFEPVALEPHGGDLAGFLLINSDPDPDTGPDAQSNASERMPTAVSAIGLGWMRMSFSSAAFPPRGPMIALIRAPPSSTASLSYGRGAVSLLLL